MQAETIIAALIGASAVGAPRLRRLFSRTEREESMSRYYRAVIKGLREENEELLRKVDQLNERVQKLEIAQDLPPGHLG